MYTEFTELLSTHNILQHLYLNHPYLIKFLLGEKRKKKKEIKARQTNQDNLFFNSHLFPMSARFSDLCYGPVIELTPLIKTKRICVISK